MTSQGEVPLPGVELLECARFAEENDLQRIEELLRAKPSLVNFEDDHGRTALHMAAANGHQHVMRLLLQFGPTVNQANTEGNTALHYAATSNNAACAQMLLDAKWSTNVTNALGRTPIQEIANRDFEEMELVLLRHDNTLDSFCPPPQFTVDDDLSDVAPTSSEEVAPARVPPEPDVALPSAENGNPTSGSALVDDVE